MPSIANVVAPSNACGASSQKEPRNDPPFSKHELRPVLAVARHDLQAPGRELAWCPLSMN